MKPAISIIVTVHNIENYISTCLNSLIRQSFKDFEVIIVNDGSTDKSGRICEAYAEKDNRIRVIHTEYGGVSAARNSGVSAATGDYIGFVDGDDYIAHMMYEKLYNLCIETESDISICHLSRQEINPEIELDEKRLIIEMDHIEALRQLFKGELYRFSLCNKLFHRKCFTGIYFPEERIHEDLATTPKLFSRSHKTVYSSFTGYIYVRRENSILTSTFNQDRIDAFTAWNEILLLLADYNNLLEDVYACYGYWAVDNVYYAIHQTNQQERTIYLNQIQHHIKPHYKKLINNKILPRKYKVLIRMMHCNIRMLIFPQYVRNLFKKEIVH